MSTLRSRLAAALGLSTTEDSLSAEIARNADGRARLAELEHTVMEEKYNNEKKIAQAEAAVKAKQERYDAQLKPSLEEFDSLCTAEHAYESIVRLIESEVFVTETLAKREADHYGYIAKKLISVSLHFEALRHKILAGLPFEKELEATLKDAERDDLNLVGAPLRAFATEGTPSDAAARAEAFILSQTIEQTGMAAEQKPLKGWLDFLRFRASLSPANMAENRILARRNAKDFMRYVKEKDYIQALSLVEKSKKLLEKQQDPLIEEFKANESAFRRVVDPILAANSFLMYGDAMLACTRYANVEQIIS